MKLAVGQSQTLLYTQCRLNCFVCHEPLNLQQSSTEAKWSSAPSTELLEIVDQRTSRREGGGEQGTPSGAGGLPKKLCDRHFSEVLQNSFDFCSLYLFLRWEAASPGLPVAKTSFLRLLSSSGPLRLFKARFVKLIPLFTFFLFMCLLGSS